MQLGGGAQITTSPNAKSDKTIFNGNVSISAGSPNATWVRQNVSLAHSPTLKNVTVVTSNSNTQRGNHGDDNGNGKDNGNHNGDGNGNGNHGDHDGNHNGKDKD
jgi:hypothetical protein